MKVTVQKTTAEGEIIILEVPGKDPADMGIKLRAGLQLLDERQLEMNRRVIAAHTQMNDLPAEVKQMVTSVHQILYGQNIEHNIAAIAEARAKLLEQRERIETAIKEAGAVEASILETASAAAEAAGAWNNAEKAAPDADKAP